MKEKIEKLLKSHLKRKLTITTATLIAFLLSSNLAMAEQKYQVGKGKIERDNSGTWENAIEYLGKEKTALFEISETNIVNRLKDFSSFTFLEEVNNSFINKGSILGLLNNGTGEIKNRGYIYELTSTTESGIENRGYIVRFTSKENIANKGYINWVLEAKNIVNDGSIGKLNENKNITNNGIIIERVYNGTHIANTGIISLADELYNTLKNNGKLENKGIVINDLGNIPTGTTDNIGREIKNYNNTNITDTSIEKTILNAYKGKIENNLQVKNSSILNMRGGTIAANKKISIDNSTVNMGEVSYNDGLQLEFKNNSKIGMLYLGANNVSDKINNLTMDNTTEAGVIDIRGNIEAINLVPNETDKNRVLRINELRTYQNKNINTNISTNVDLSGVYEKSEGNYIQLGNITVEDKGRLTIAKDALMYNGYDDSSDKYYKKDIIVKDSGKIIIGIDPYNIGQTEKLGDGNNLTESVIGQKDPDKTSERLPQSALGMDADSRLHDIVILGARKLKYQKYENSSWIEYEADVRNEYKVIEATELATPIPEEPEPDNGGGTPDNGANPPSSVPTDHPVLNDLYKIFLTAGKVKELSVYNNAQLFGLYEYLRDMYANSPYALSGETSFKNLAMLRDNAYLDLKPNLNKWAVMGGLSHSDRENKFKHELGTTEADTITTGAYAKGEYGLKEDTTLGLILGGTNSKSDLLTGKVKGSSIYLGAYAKKYVNNFKFTLGTGLDLGEYKVDRNAIGYAGIIETEKYSAKQKNRAFDLYAEARYSKDLGNNFYLEPNFNLAYSRVRQGGATENDGKINLDIKSKTFNQTTAALGLDLKKVLLNGNTSHSFALGTAYERLLSGAKENSLRASLVGGSGSGFDILVPEKEKGRTSIGAEYKLENKVGILFNLKMDYGFKHGSDKKDIRFSTGLGYKF